MIGNRNTGDPTSRWTDNLDEDADPWRMQTAFKRGNWRSIGESYVQQWMPYNWYDDNDDDRLYKFCFYYTLVFKWIDQVLYIYYFIFIFVAINKIKKGEGT